MDNLQTQIDNLRTLQESYDVIAQAAEAYNTGKTELAANLRAKGIEVDASESLPALAEKVTQIQTQEITIDGGEMYEKQIFGGTSVESGQLLWNLYKILADIKSDGRFDNYGGILLAEYYKGYDSIELQNAGAGGAYYTCDGYLYDTDVTHVWHDEDNGYANRWVAYLFRNEYTNYTIPSTNLCPRSIFIGRKVGDVILQVAGRLTEVVVQDGEELKGLNFAQTATPTNPWQKFLNLRNIQTVTGPILNANTNVVVLYIDAESIGAAGAYNFGYGNCASLTTIIAPRLKSIPSSDRGVLSNLTASLDTIYMPELTSQNTAGLFYDTRLRARYVYFPKCKSLARWTWWAGGGNSYFRVIYTPSWLNTNTQIFWNGFVGTTLEDIWVGETTQSIHLDEWNPTAVIADEEKLAQLNANIRDHIAARVSDRTGTTPLTFTISQNLRNNLETATEDAFAAKNWNIAPARTN